MRKKKKQIAATAEQPAKQRKGKGFLKKHKILSGGIALLLVAAIVTGGVLVSHKKNSTDGYSFIRTTTLAKGTLEDTISATGTVTSAKTSKVTTALNYTVKSVNVAVGDTVKKGDVICTLNTEEPESQIEKEKENLEKAKSTAQTSYSNAQTAYSTAKAEYEAYEDTLNSAKSAYDSAKTPYDNAVNSLATYQSAYDTALKNYNAAGAKYTAAMAKYNAAVSAYKNGKTSVSKLQSAAKEYMKAVQNYYGGCAIGSYDISDSASSALGDSMEKGNTSQSTSGVAVEQSADSICQNVITTVQTLTKKTLSLPSGSNTLLKLSRKAEALRNAKSICNYDSLESTYTAAEEAYNNAKQTYSQLKEALSQAKSQLTQASEELENASSSDTLEQLQDQLEECSLKAEQDGTVTALNATVGSVCKDAVATIQDLENLRVDITIEEADINKAVIGLKCHITNDASDETLDGTLIQTDPVSSDGSFGATVSVDSQTTALHIGMNASVDIIVSSEEDVYQVPIDAVGNDNGTGFVYRQTGGSGTDMQFEKVTVTTGSSNDYYIEISSSALSEGDVIRSSADLSEGIETISEDKGKSDSASGLFAGLFGGSMNQKGGEMPMGGGGNSRQGGSGFDDMGGPPSGGMPGGNNE